MVGRGFQPAAQLHVGNALCSLRGESTNRDKAVRNGSPFRFAHRLLSQRHTSEYLKRSYIQPVKYWPDAADTTKSFRMDPLSITASIIAVLGAASAIITTISNLKNAPAEFTALFNELTAIRVVCCNARDLVDVSRVQDVSIDGHLELLEKLSHRAEAKLNEIHELVRTDLTNAQKGGDDVAHPPKVTHMRWVKTKSRLRQLREELREIRSLFIPCVGNITR